MKNIFILLWFLSGLQTGFAQSKNDESMDGLAGPGGPATGRAQSLQEFTRIVQKSEKIFVDNGGTFDSGAIIRLHQIAGQLNRDSLLAISYNWIGSYLAFGKGDNVAALEYFFKALPLAEKAKDKRRISSLYFDIALTYFALKDNEKAGENIHKGGENLPDPSSSMFNFMLVQYQRDMAQYYLNASQPDSALHYAQAALETSHRLKSASFEHMALYLSGEAYAQTSDREMAGIYFRKAMAMIDSIKLDSRKMDFYGGYTRFLLSSGRVTEAYQQARQLLSMAQQDGNDNMKLSADTLLREVFDSMHRVDSAYYYLKAETAVSASIFSRNNINRVQSLAFNEQLRSMEEKARQDEEKRRRKENIQYILIALGIVSLLMLYLLLSRSFITNGKLIEFFGIMALLIVFEFLNLILHPFLESITRHIPVLMLLSLVSIAALLVPLHHRLEKWTTTRLVEKNKAIRLAAAKRTIEQLGKKPESL